MSSTMTEPRTAAVPLPTYEGDFVLEGDLLLECGRILSRPVLHYAVYGRLNEARDNAVLVCHALSGSALVGSWWPGLFDGIVDLGRDCAICVNLLGSCYGSTGPGSVDAETGEIFGPEFPLVSIGDNVRAQARHEADFEALRDHDVFRQLIEAPPSDAGGPGNIRRSRRGRLDR